MILSRYTSDKRKEWNEFVACSRNGTFLLDRNFMEYHSDRFEDASLLFYKERKLMAVLPANFDSATRTVYSHQGLTYGGLIMSEKLTAKGVMEAFELMTAFFQKKLNAERMIYKPIPYIYNRYVCDEDLYALFRHNAALRSRGLSTCIELNHRLPFTELRKRCVKKAMYVTVRETDDVKDFWQILNEVLVTSHNVNPVHSAEEIKLLMDRFPDNIKLFGAYDEEGCLIAGSLIFDTGNVIHTQYLASSTEGKCLGALDKVISTIITKYSHTHRYMDFGISTEEGGKILNEGLIFQKEGFGGRGICYDQWEIAL